MGKLRVITESDYNTLREAVQNEEYRGRRNVANDPESHLSRWIRKMRLRCKMDGGEVVYTDKGNKTRIVKSYPYLTELIRWKLDMDRTNNESSNIDSFKQDIVDKYYINKTDVTAILNQVNSSSGQHSEHQQQMQMQHSQKSSSTEPTSPSIKRDYSTFQESEQQPNISSSTTTVRRWASTTTSSATLPPPTQGSGSTWLNSNLLPVPISRNTQYLYPSNTSNNYESNTSDNNASDDLPMKRAKGAYNDPHDVGSYHFPSLAPITSSVVTPSSPSHASSFNYMGPNFLSTSSIYNVTEHTENYGEVYDAPYHFQPSYHFETPFGIDNQSQSPYATSHIAMGIPISRPPTAPQVNEENVTEMPTQFKNIELDHPFYFNGEYLYSMEQMWSKVFLPLIQEEEEDERSRGDLSSYHPQMLDDKEGILPGDVVGIVDEEFVTKKWKTYDAPFVSVVPNDPKYIVKKEHSESGFPFTWVGEVSTKISPSYSGDIVPDSMLVASPFEDGTCYPIHDPAQVQELDRKTVIGKVIKQIDNDPITSLRRVIAMISLNGHRQSGLVKALKKMTSEDVVKIEKSQETLRPQPSWPSAREKEENESSKWQSGSEGVLPLVHVGAEN